MLNVQGLRWIIVTPKKRKREKILEVNLTLGINSRKWVMNKK